MGYSSNSFAMHTDQLTLPGQITAPSSNYNPIPVRPPTPYESLYPQQGQPNPYQDYYDPEYGKSRVNTTEIRSESANIFVFGETRTPENSIATLISNTSKKMLEEMHQEMLKTGVPINDRLNEMKSLLKEMKGAQKKQRNLSFISYGIACATTSYLFYKSVTENQ
jgi:hypothetical protein